MTQPKHGKAALDQLYRGVRQPGRPLLFLDIDDVICLSSPYGGFDLFTTDDKPADLYEKLWHAPAVEVLLAIMQAHRPWVVMTTSWLRLMDRAGFEALFRRTGLAAVADSLHEVWDAPQDYGMTRCRAIEKWLHARYTGVPVAVLDDSLSGTGLRGSRLDKAGCLVLCEVGVGLQQGHVDAVARALTAGGDARAGRAAEQLVRLGGQVLRGGGRRQDPGS